MDLLGCNGVTRGRPPGSAGVPPAQHWHSLAHRLHPARPATAPGHCIGRPHGVPGGRVARCRIAGKPSGTQRECMRAGRPRSRRVSFRRILQKARPDYFQIRIPGTFVSNDELRRRRLRWRGIPYGGSDVAFRAGRLVSEVVHRNDLTIRPLDSPHVTDIPTVSAVAERDGVRSRSCPCRR